MTCKKCGRKTYTNAFSTRRSNKYGQINSYYNCPYCELKSVKRALVFSYVLFCLTVFLGILGISGSIIAIVLEESILIGLAIFILATILGVVGFCVFCLKRKRQKILKHQIALDVQSRTL